MPIILFLIDNSGSMNQRAHLGAKPTLLDLTKEAVERFIKVRQRDANSRGDRYMLLTLDEVPYNIKAGWKETHNVFINELKNLSATGLTTISSALRNCFDYLNVNRIQTGIDNFGFGRFPYFLESAIIILITDGSKYLTNNNVQEDLVLPPAHCPGSEWTTEPYRWDQRLFSVVLRLSGVYKSEQNVIDVPCDNSPINSLCETTGGRSFCVTSKNEINWSLDQIAMKMQNSVVMIKFEKFGPDPPMIIDENEKNNHYDPNNRNWHNTRNMVLVKPSSKGYSVGNWPIPESYWIDPNCPKLVPRSAHPVIKFTCTNSEPAVIENLPFDKYELNPSPLTQFILSRKQSNVAWQVFVANSQRNSELGQPFGYLKASTSLTCVNLFVLPYNYPLLLPLLQDLLKQMQGKPNREWRQQFDNYLKGMPIYYSGLLRRALQKMGAPPNMVPDSMEYSTAISNLIKKQKILAKTEYEKLTSSMGQHRPINIEWPRISANHHSLIYHSKKTNSELFCSNPHLKRAFSRKQNDFQDFNGFIVRHKDKTNAELKTSFYRNPADIPRDQLLNQAFRLRQVFFKKQLQIVKYMEEDQIYSLPVGQMGNYQDYLKKAPSPLREIESSPTRQHMFGNPFKLDKKNNMMIDETDIDLVAGSGSQPSRGLKRSYSDSFLNMQNKPKRKPGPIPKDFIYIPYRNRGYSSAPSTPPRPMYSQNMPSPYPQGAVPGIGVQLPPQAFYNEFHANNSMFNNGAQSNVASGAQPKYIQQSNHLSKTSNSQNKYPMSPFNTALNNSNNVPQMGPASPSNHLSKVNQEMNESIMSKLIGYTPPVQEVHVPINQINKTIRPLPIVPSTTPKSSLVSNGSFSSLNMSPSNPFPKLLTSHAMQSCSPIVNGIQNKAYLDPRKNLLLNNEEKEKLKTTLHYVRIKDEKSLIQILSANRGPFGDFLLYQAVSLAQRFEMKPLIQTLSNHFGNFKIKNVLDSYNTSLNNNTAINLRGEPKKTSV